jgi:glycosyltransferase involved in cell wall biosynthesis
MAFESLVIHAPNVHQGGGKTLLVALLRALDADATGQILLDQRLQVSESFPSGMVVRRFAPSLAERLRAEAHLARVVQPTSRVLCFGSLPPLWRCRGRVAVFVQNRNIIARTDISEYPLKQRLRIGLARLWFRRFRANADQFIVQTETMRDLLRRQLGRLADIRVAPLVPKELLQPGPAGNAISAGAAKMYDFCYVSTGDPHKNHRTLIEAWILLARQQCFPSLCLTVSAGEFPRLHRWIADMQRRHGLNVANVGYVSSERIDEIYAGSRALIYPSLYESFGLPLVEARRHGLNIVAPERDYVRDVVVPDECFDPLSARSIARAVERLGRGVNSCVALVDGRSFVSRLLAA